jgi:hypothetical protein
MQSVVEFDAMESHRVWIVVQIFTLGVDLIIFGHHRRCILRWRSCGDLDRPEIFRNFQDGVSSWILPVGLQAPGDGVTLCVVCWGSLMVATCGAAAYSVTVAIAEPWTCFRFEQWSQCHCGSCRRWNEQFPCMAASPCSLRFFQWLVLVTGNDLGEYVQR